MFLILAEIKTSSPTTGNLGSKEMLATERSDSFGVVLFILPGVLCSISVDDAQFPERFDGAS